MCSFLITTKKYDEKLFRFANEKQQRRGPDATSIIEFDNFVFIHNLLSITGEYTEQPFFNRDKTKIAIFNGEIYNAKEFTDQPSDGYSIIPAYETFGEKFASKLDGEFAICVIDKIKNVMIITTDTFGTKPLWLSIENGEIAISSYKSAINNLGFSQQHKIPPNTTIIISLNEMRAIKRLQLTDFSLYQFKRNFDDWCIAFEKSIAKRASNTRENLFIGLSSGYDSGAIACELNKQKIKYKSYSIIAAEDINVLNARKQRVENNTIISLKAADYAAQQSFIANYAEAFKTAPRKNRPTGYDVFADKGAIGTGIICNEARKDNCKIYLSGQGSDEIMSDYGFNGKPAPGFLHCTIAGKFPTELSTVFPWENFFTGTQEEFLYKDESIAGLYGIESRYPFLDKELVQEFLWLSEDLKNANYKSPLDFYLTKNNFPFAKGVHTKVGFRANSNLV